MGPSFRQFILKGGLLMAACPFVFAGAPLSRPTRPAGSVAQSAPPAPAQSPAQSRSTGSSSQAYSGGRQPSPAQVSSGGSRRKAESGARAGKPVPVSELCKTLGLNLRWTEQERAFVLTGAFAKLEFEVDSRECEINGQRVFLGEAVRMGKAGPQFSSIDAEKFIVPMIRPGRGASAIPKLRTVMIDPGHGGVDAGKINSKLGVNEKTFTLDTALRLKALLERQGLKVLMTRKDDRFIELADRPEMAERAGADLFISIHFNSVESKAESVTGVEVFTLAPQWQLSSDQKPDPVYAPLRNPGNEHDHWNTVIGAAVHKELLEELKVSDRGMKRSRFAVLRLAPCPAVLVESGYLSNNEEARRIASSQYRQRIAEALAAGVSRYAQSLEAARKARP